MTEGEVGGSQIKKKFEYTYILLVPWDGFQRLTGFVSIVSDSLGKEVGALRCQFALRSKDAS